MTDAHVSTQLQAVMDEFRRRKSLRDGDTRTLDQIRAEFSPAGQVHPVPADVEVTTVDAGGVPATWFAPPGHDGTVLLYLHGGGFSVGSAVGYGELVSRLARAAGARALLPEYRLAPEHQYPAAIDDASVAWSWLRASGVDAGRVVVAGDSAGGALALALVTALRDAGSALPAALALFSPMADLTASGESVDGRAERDPIFTAEMIRGTGPAYAGDADLRDPRVSPLFADLHGLPPLLVQVGTEETLFSDSERLVAAASSAGVDVSLEVGDGLPHVYQAVPDAPEAVAATDRAGAFLRHAVETSARA